VDRRTINAHYTYQESSRVSTHANQLAAAVRLYYAKN